MSQYIYFYIKGTEMFYQISSYSASTQIYKCFADYAPYSAVVPLTAEANSKIRTNIKSWIDTTKDRIKECKDRINIVKAMEGGSISEKLEIIENEMSYVKEYEITLDGLEFAYSFSLILQDMIDEVKYSDGPIPVDEDEYIYFGIEPEDYPTFKNIEEEEAESYNDCF